MQSAGVAKTMTFEQARNRRQMARAAGLHPDFWYPVGYSEALRPGGILATRFWGCPIVVFRGVDGALRSLEDRCAHRQLKLSLGQVDGCRITCPYHGWSYGGDGRLEHVPHELFGRTTKRIRVAALPVRARYGLIWIFPGDPSRADSTPMPEIPELEGPDRWAFLPFDFTWHAHHSMIIENLSDFTHAYLHRDYRPIIDAKLRHYETVGSRVTLQYEVLVADGRFSKYFIDRKKVDVNSMEVGLQYPHQWSNTGNRIKHWCFLLPMDERTTRVFFIFYFDALRIPFTRAAIPRWLMGPILQAAKHLTFRPLFSQDGRMVEAEQLAYEASPEVPAIEFNPVVSEFQKLIIQEWRRHLADQAEPIHPSSFPQAMSEPDILESEAAVA